MCVLCLNFGCICLLFVCECWLCECVFVVCVCVGCVSVGWGLLSGVADGLLPDRKTGRAGGAVQERLGT